MHIRSWRGLIAVWLFAALYTFAALSGPASWRNILAFQGAAKHQDRSAAAVQIMTPTPAPSLSPSAAVAAPIPTAQAPSGPAISRSNPFVGERLFIDPDSPAMTTAASWRSTRPADAAIMDKIAKQPVTTWLGGWYDNIGQATTQLLGEMRAQGDLPVFVLYNIPIRDCGSYSAGGASSPAAYRAWIQAIQNASKGSKAVFLLEPDALPGWECLSSAQRSERSTLLRDAINTLTSSPNHYVYLDAGNSRWHTVQDIAARLKDIGTSRLTGVTLNISNFLTTAESKQYGSKLSSLTGGLHVVIDTSRNGAGPTSDLQWCNPPGRKLGEAPRATPGQGELDALLWVKYPGESDGSCNGAPEAGEWWPDYALGLAR